MLHSSWQETIDSAYRELPKAYREYLEQGNGYFPTMPECFNAFTTLPKENVRYILFGQDPYPREQSATGYAFIDGKVGSLFGENGLSRDVNRATSLRNFIKMALVAKGVLTIEDTSQEAIAQLGKEALIQTAGQLKDNFERSGVLLLNSALIFSAKSDSNKHIKMWQPFIRKVLQEMQTSDPALILFGTHAKALGRMGYTEGYRDVTLEHPYNHTFITNPKALELFAPMDLLARHH
jgi:uracil-DNA glycosylase